MTMNAGNLKPVRADEFPFSDSNFAVLSAIAKERFGLDIQVSKKQSVYARLAKRVRELQLHSFDDYCAIFEQSACTDELDVFLSAITTNVTQFFRENHHFEYLAKTLAPSFLTRAQAGEPIRLWSAACSSGQEAYSMAAALLLAAPQLAHADLRILATDIDPKVIDAARSGLFPIDQKPAIPSNYHSLMLQPAPTTEHIQMSDVVRDVITFGELNLIEPWPMRRKFDVIFCRNTTIYFDKATQRDLWKRFANCTCDGGHLMIGHSERISGAAKFEFQSAGITTYKKQCVRSGDTIHENGIS